MQQGLRYLSRDGGSSFGDVLANYLPPDSLVTNWYYGCV
jgi:hypothetical protein